jgi:hypothetical protein
MIDVINFYADLLTRFYSIAERPFCGIDFKAQEMPDGIPGVTEKPALYALA